jgi:phospholipid/cholesterol/gamma-HCH transport system substrate-binding protein
MQGVSVPLMIYDNVKIPKGSRFTIGSSGLLGDRFVDIVVDKSVAKAPPLAAGNTVEGEREAAISDIISTVNRVAEQASTLMTHLDATVQDVGAVAKKIQKDLLQPDSLQNLAITLSNLKSTSENFAQASHRLDGIMTSVSSTIGGSKKTFSSVDSAAEEVRKTASDLRSLLQMSKQGQGTLGLLLNNTEVSSNLRAFILNLRKYGILWYKNRTPTSSTNTSSPLPSSPFSRLFRPAQE